MHFRAPRSITQIIIQAPFYKKSLRKAVAKGASTIIWAAKAVGPTPRQLAWTPSALEDCAFSMLKGQAFCAVQHTVVGIKYCTGACTTSQVLCRPCSPCCQVWAVKSYTKSVPLYIQVLQRNSLQLIAPFLDPEHDVIVSMEQTRHRLLALSCLCPGASTLIG